MVLSEYHEDNAFDCTRTKRLQLVDTEGSLILMKNLRLLTPNIWLPTIPSKMSMILYFGSSSNSEHPLTLRPPEPRLCPLLQTLMLFSFTHPAAHDCSKDFNVSMLGSSSKQPTNILGSKICRILQPPYALRLHTSLWSKIRCMLQPPYALQFHTSIFPQPLLICQCLHTWQLRQLTNI